MRKSSSKKPARTTPSKGSVENRRASAEAIEKRRAARRFNDVLLGGARPARDGRTEKRRQRLLKELAEGTARGGRTSLKPIDLLMRVQALLELGESPSALRKVRRPPKSLPSTAELVDGVRRLHHAYDFDPEVYQFVGLDHGTLREAGVLPRAPALRGRASAGADGPGLVAPESRRRVAKRGAA